MTDSQIATLSDQFILVLSEWLTPDEIAEVNRRNDADGYAADLTCHTHDFCDANMAMDAAFRTVVGHEVDGDNENDCRLWNEAWSLAKTKRFTWEQ